MRMKLLLLMTGVLCWASGAEGAYIEIGEGEYGYGIVLRNNDSLVVRGGGASEVEAWNFSSIEVDYTSTPLRLDVGGISVIDLLDQSTLNYKGGETGILYLWNNARAELRGGRIDYMRSYQDADDLVQVGWDYEKNVPIFKKHIEMIVREWSYDAHTRVLTGVWDVDNNKDGAFDTFATNLVYQAGYDPVINNITFTIVPEPATIMLLGLGGVLLRKRAIR
jgi:hypothetical protein